MRRGPGTVPAPSSPSGASAVIPWPASASWPSSCHRLARENRATGGNPQAPGGGFVPALPNYVLITWLGTSPLSHPEVFNGLGHHKEGACDQDEVGGQGPGQGFFQGHGHRGEALAGLIFLPDPGNLFRGGRPGVAGGGDQRPGPQRGKLPGHALYILVHRGAEDQDKPAPVKRARTASLNLPAAS